MSESNAQETGRKANLAYVVTAAGIAILFIIGSFLPFLGSVNVNSSKSQPTQRAHILTGVTHIWSQSSGNLASTAANWNPASTPDTGDTIVFDSGSAACTWDISKTLGAFYVNATYTGVITVAADFEISSIHISSGTFTGSTSYTVTDSGDFDGRGGNLTTAALQLVMNGSGKTVYTSSDANVDLYALTINGDTTVSGSYSIGIYKLTTASGKTITNCANPMRIYPGLGSYSYSNSGSIVGASTLAVDVRANTATTFGAITCPVEIFVGSGRSTAVLSLAANTTFGGQLAVDSQDATATITLDVSTGDYSLTAAGLLIGTNAILNARDSVITINGNMVITGTFTKGTSSVIVVGSYRVDEINPTSAAIGSNPSDMHGLCPVHDSYIQEVDKIVDGSSRKYLAYATTFEGDRINLYYADSVTGPWVAYSGNPVLGPTNRTYRTPSATYVNGTFQLFVENPKTYQVKRYTSTNGIAFTLAETVLTNGKVESYTNPFIYKDPASSGWYLYWFDKVGSNWTIKERHASLIAGLSAATDTLLLNSSATLAWPSVGYKDGKYLMFLEYSVVNVNWAIAVYSSDHPGGPFTMAIPTTITIKAFADQACPEFVLDNRSNGYLFSDLSPLWYQEVQTIFTHIHEFYDFTYSSANPNPLCMAIANQSIITMRGVTLRTTTTYWLQLNITSMTGGLISWISNCTSTSNEVTFTLSGLGPNIGYDWFVDNVKVASIMADASGVVQYTYSGPWGEHEFEVVETGHVIPEFSSPSSMVGVAITMVAAMVVMKRRRGSRIRA